MSDARSFLMGGDKVRPAFSWPKGQFHLHPPVGKRIEGTITEEPTLQQQRDYDDNEKLLWWDDACTRPKNQLVITVQTDLRDGEVSEAYPNPDDGLRRYYVKGDLQKAMRKAIKDAGADDVLVGGWLAVTYTGDGEAAISKKSGKPLNPPHLFAVEYRPPQSKASEFLNTPTSADPWSTSTPPNPAYSPPAQASYTPPPAAPSELTPDMKAAFEAYARQQQGR